MEETSTVRYAGIGTRFLAALIDGIILSVVGGVLGSISGGGNNGNLFTLVLSLAYYIYFLGTTGQTLGKKVMKVKVVNEDGSTPTYATAAIRTIATYLSGAVLLLGYIWAFFNPKRQTWHDLIAKTYVVEAE